MSATHVVEGRINGLDLCGSIQKITDAKAIKDAGFEYVYVQSSRYSSTPELSFEKTVDLLRTAGLRVGAYHFCSHDTDPVKQAEFFYKASRGLGSKPGELPPMVDWEHCTPQRYPNHPQHCVDWVTQNLQSVTRLWYPDNHDRVIRRYPVLYSYPVYCGSHQPALACSRLNEYSLCYASYKSVYDESKKAHVLVGWLPTAEQGPLHKLPEPFTNWTLWQYSGNNGLAVPGIRGDCDRQVFSGSSADFARFCGINRVHEVNEWKVKEDEQRRK